MNLTTGKWIPIVWSDGRYDKVGLLDIFQQGDQIADLAVRPHERIALMRLLICIAQAALDGPANRDDWKTCLPRIAPAATDYLNRWQRSFELFGDGPRFLQVMEIEKGTLGKLPSIAKLDVRLASGDSSTLFDNNGADERMFPADAIALMLLVFQNFSPGGTLSMVQWGARKTQHAGNKSGPALDGKMVHSLRLSNASILRTIWMNLANKELAIIHGYEWGKPIWELMPRQLPDNAATRNATETYMGRLVPLSRFIKLDADFKHLLWGAGFLYPGFSDGFLPDPFSTVYKVSDRSGNSTRAILSISPEKALWRSLHAIAVLRHDDKSCGGPWALSNDADEQSELYAAGIAYKPRQAAKLLGIYESRFRVPQEMFSDQGQRSNIYCKGVEQAEAWASRLLKAIQRYRTSLNDDLEKPAFRERRNTLTGKAAAHYWTAIEQHVPDLLKITENPELLYPDGADQACWSKTPWGQAVAIQARAAYDLACPHESPRHMQAYVEGLKSLYGSQAKPEEAVS